MNRNSALANRIFILSAVLICASCLEEFNDLDKLKPTTFSPQLEFPLVNSDFTMDEFLTEGESNASITEQSGVMVLTYDDTLRTPGGDNFFLLPDQHSPVISIQGPDVTFPSPGGSITINRNITFAFNPSSGESLDSIVVKAGSMDFNIDSNFPANINLTISIPTLETSGTGFQQNFLLNGPSVQTPSRNLQGSTFDLTANGTTTNLITFAITAVITDTGQPINNTHHLNCSFDVNDLAFRGLFGDLGTRGYNIPLDSVDIDIFSNAEAGGTFELLSPAIQLDIKNSFGLPVGFNILNMTSIKADETTVPLSGAAVSAPLNPYTLGAPTYNQIGQSITSQVAINSNNSNLAAVVSSMPRYLAYQFGLQLNPGGQTKNFVMDDSKLEIGVHFELPFHGRFANLTVTKDYDFNGLGIDDIIDSSIKVKTINETPLEAQVQVLFLDGNGTVLETLFANPSILDGAPVDASGATQGSSEVVTTVALNQAKVDRINQATTLRITTSLFTTDAGSVPVKFSAVDKLKVSIGLNARIEYKLN